MESFIMNELYPLVNEEFEIQPGKIGIFGHSMGGHGALTLAFKYPEKFVSVSAFAPICAPSQCPWGEKAFSNYLGEDRAEWAKHDATELVKAKGGLYPDILIDQGFNDQFYSQLNPALFQQACDAAGQKLTLREHQGYDHGYYFIQSFVDDHLQFHAVQLEN
jgi:S-formylglutathione hydrolase